MAGKGKEISSYGGITGGKKILRGKRGFMFHKEKSDSQTGRGKFSYLSWFPRGSLFSF